MRSRRKRESIVGTSPKVFSFFNNKRRERVNGAHAYSRVIPRDFYIFIEAHAHCVRVKRDVELARENFAILDSSMAVYICMCASMYMYVCICLRMHVFMHAYMCTCIFVYVYTCMHTSVEHVRIRSLIRFFFSSNR